MNLILLRIKVMAIYESELTYRRAGGNLFVKIKEIGFSSLPQERELKRQSPRSEY